MAEGTCAAVRWGDRVVSVENEASPAVRGVQDAGKAVADAAGTIASDRLRVEVNARSSKLAVDLKAIANAMRASSASLHEQGHDGHAELIDDLARRADRLAARLATADPDDLTEDAKRLAEAAAFAQEPFLVIAGAFTLGLLVPKVLESWGRVLTNEDPQTRRTRWHRRRTVRRSRP